VPAGLATTLLGPRKVAFTKLRYLSFSIPIFTRSSPLAALGQCALNAFDCDLYRRFFEEAQDGDRYDRSPLGPDWESMR
jgi:hypothetical protein